MQDSPLLTLTPAAADMIRQICESQELADYSLRVHVSGGGCSGLVYGVELDTNEPEEMDIVLEDQGIRIFVDSYSARRLQGSTVDYVAQGAGGGFKIDNPNAVKACGCGSSFSMGDDNEGCGANQGGCGSCGR